jgi:hypothetical protein
MKGIEKLPLTSPYLDAEYNHLVERKINEIIDQLNERCQSFMDNCKCEEPDREHGFTYCFKCKKHIS